jgi:CRP-like cAMP-binding protein
MADDAQLQRLSRELFLLALTLEPGESLPSWVVDRIASLLDEVEVTAGQVIFAAGDPADYIYFMSKGRVILSREGSAPWTYEGRWAIGLFEVIKDCPRTRTATALRDFRMMRIKGEAWLDILEDSFAFGRASLERSSRTVASLTEQLAARGLAPVPLAAPLMTLPKGQGRLNLIERLAVLYELVHLRDAGVQTLAELAAVAEEVTFAAGEEVLAAGARKDRTFIILEGEIEASRTAPPLRQIYGAGTVVLGAATFGDASTPWGARATVATHTLAMYHDDWFDLLEEHFGMLRSVLGAMATQRDKMLEQLADQDGGLVLT